MSTRKRSPFDFSLVLFLAYTTPDTNSFFFSFSFFLFQPRNEPLRKSNPRSPTRSESFPCQRPPTITLPTRPRPPSLQSGLLRQNARSLTKRKRKRKNLFFRWEGTREPPNTTPLLLPLRSSRRGIPFPPLRSTRRGPGWQTYRPFSMVNVSVSPSLSSTWVPRSKRSGGNPTASLRFATIR
jgi:hypothetical protein